MKKARERSSKAAAAAAIAAASCASGSQEDGNQTVRHSDPPVESAGMNEAHAATAEPAPAVTSQPDASVEETEVVMPDDPAHVSFEIARVDDVRVLQSNGQEYPAHLTRVTQKQDTTVVTLIVPRAQSAEESPPEFTLQELRQVGTDQSGQPVLQVSEGREHRVRFSITARSLVATEKRLRFGAKYPEFYFGDGAQKVLELGENSLTGPVVEEFLDGEMRLVVEGIFTAPENVTCHVELFGCERAYVWLNGRMECRTGPFEARLCAGQKMGIYPVVDATVTQAVQANLQASPTPTQEE
jgi:hypothetical protein